MSSQIPTLDEAFFNASFGITRAWIERVAHMTSCKPPAHPGRLHPFLGQVIAVLRDTDVAPGFDPPKSYCPPPIRFPEHVRFMTPEQVLARWGWEEREARESPEYYGRLVEMLRDMQADEATADLAWERLALHGWATDAYFWFNPDDEEGAMIGTPADVNLYDDEEGLSIGDPADVDLHNEEASAIGDPADVDWEDVPSDDDDGDVTIADDAASASPTLPNGITEDDLEGFDPVIRANILRLAAEDAEEDTSGIEDIDEVSDWAVPPDSDNEPTEDEIQAWATAAATAPSEWENYEEEEGWETDDGNDDVDGDEEDDEIVWPGWAAPGVGFPNPNDHAFPMYLVPHVMHENAWHEGSTHYFYVRGRLVCCGLSGPPRGFEGCSQGRREAGNMDDNEE
ncbi:putative DNA polymerase alpha catalytic subunit [Lasiodiplodia theobromae]|uniref:putative DNA polymerase alpha catalytic subunit n=1 Tax=Lasiodiplodia theobromae TaxID=45133 RepID=UPI0015C2D5AD|nr:putative DNA polymerase alpha catalytic subunit [Lasiodiplodia theobromae]KAF4544338.1 putative DNA polymerase alpha catalytic subunit [Lasiodiplodia theobromae]